MPYQIWRSLNAKQKLEALEKDSQETLAQIWQEFNKLAVEREDFITGSPEKIEVFIIGKWKIYYRVLHRLKIIDIIDIIEIP